MNAIAGQVVRYLKYFIFWMIFFLLVKVLFLLWNIDQTAGLSGGEIFGIFWHGLKMDVSTACYLLVIPGLVLAFFPFVGKRMVDNFFRFYTFFLLVIASFLVVLDLGLYPHWGTRVNITAFNYVNDPIAMSASVSFADVIKGILVSGSLITIFIIVYRRIFRNGVGIEPRPRWYYVPLQLFLVATLILPIRGGLDTAPLNLSSVAFSPKLYVNQAACNYLWNFFKSVEKRKRLSNPCTYMPKEESEALFSGFVKNDTIVPHYPLISPVAGKQPNVILVILESFSDKVIEDLGGLPNAAPNLDSLSRRSTVFTAFYATGNRSDRGISAVLGGYPSLLSTSIMVYPEKSRSLTLLPEYFNEHNYHTSFYYGGDINFYNLKTFVLQSNCAKITTKADFPAKLGRMSKWGVPDGYVFDRALKDLESEPEPFMKGIYTISSHPPYDVPYSKIKGGSIAQKYLNSVAYTDSCLGHFIREFRKSPLWKNTLLLVTADHGHMEPGPTDITDPETYRIPLIWSGGLVDSIQRIDRIAMQADFGTTLVHELGWETKPSRFSKDIFSPNPHAFYALDSGWGYITPEGCFYFDQNEMKFVRKPEQADPVDLESPKAFMQVLHEDFINR